MTHLPKEIPLFIGKKDIKIDQRFWELDFVKSALNGSIEEIQEQKKGFGISAVHKDYVS